MRDEGLHDQLAAYALGALDDDERSAFEGHLAECERCRAALGDFRETTATLAYAAEGPEPREALRGRILEEAQKERPTQSVVVLRPRRAVRVSLAVAAAAAIVAIGLGVWAASLSRSLDSERSARSEAAQAAAILADDGAQRLALGDQGAVIRGENGDAVMVVRNMPAAPAGKTYEAWVIDDGVPARAGTFEGGGHDLVLLERPVPDGAVVAVTVEPDGGVDQPTGDIVTSTGAA